MGQLRVFVPVTPTGQVEAGTVQGFAPTPALYEAFDLTGEQEEEADYAALVLASVQALADHGARTVIALAVDDGQVADRAPGHNGEVSVSDVRPAQVTSWFADAPGVDVAAAAAEAAGHDLDDAWEGEQVQQLLREHALLWHTPQESRGPSPATEQED